MATDVFPNPGGPQTLTSRVTSSVKWSSTALHSLSRPTKFGNASGMHWSGTNKSEETTQTNYIAGNNQNFVVVINNNIKKTELYTPG